MRNSINRKDGILLSGSIIAATSAYALFEGWRGFSGLQGSWPVLAVLCLAALVSSLWTLRKLAHARENLQDTNDSLAARVTELATLHAIGREIASSLDLKRVFRIVERECRKILDVDRFSIALADPDSHELTTVYLRNRGEPTQEEQTPIQDGLELTVAVEKRAVLLDDRDLKISDGGPSFEPVENDYRSALAAPLIIEDRVIGVMVVRSLSMRAYDGNQLAVLTTIAQQAAVAIENARHHKMATTDSLTGLFVKDYFFRRVEEEYQRARRYRGNFGLLMIDLDGFKNINDIHGHITADHYLQSLSSEIRSCLRTADLACRFGGDEFCLLLPETDLEGSRIIAERMREAVAGLSLSEDGDSLKTTISIGVAAFPDHDTGDLRGLLRRADQALYRAKRTGKNRVIPFTTRAFPQSVRQRRPKANRMREASRKLAK